MPAQAGNLGCRRPARDSFAIKGTRCFTDGRTDEGVLASDGLSGLRHGFKVMQAKPNPFHTLLFSVCFALFAGDVNAQGSKRKGEADPPQLVLAHYMPWFAARPVSPSWGWHWTMNHFDPEKQKDGKREIASHFHPLIGPYDSSDVDVIEYHLLVMKLAGIDGVIVDWYGLTDFRDYAALHRNTTRLLEQCERLKMKFVICYEDQTIPALVEGKKLQPGERVAHATREIEWLGKYWFKSPSYVSLDGRPVLLSFGQTGLTDEEWSLCLKQAAVEVTYFSQHHRRSAAVGAFDWPVPSEGMKAFERFEKSSRQWKSAIPVAFPRFVDIYAQAQVGPSYGQINDDDGKPFRRMLELGLKSKAPLVQLATWNDWGEGTQIEPSHEFGYRDLETVQNLRVNSSGQPVAAAIDLRLPIQLLEQRRNAKDAGDVNARRLDEISALIVSGQLSAARSLLKHDGAK